MRDALSLPLRARLRLVSATCVGLLCYLLLPASMGQLQRLLIGWNVLAWLYLALIWYRMLRTASGDIVTIARQQDQSATLVLSMVIIACLISIAAILSELSTLKQLSGTPRLVHVLLTASTLVVSWALLPSTFALHYAHQHYLQRGPDVTPLIFPETCPNPGYWDFLYFSFTLAVASQTADVATGTTEMRRLVLLQSVISFLFNLAILGLSVNVAAGLLN